MSARNYYGRVQAAVRAAPHVLSSQLQFEEIDVSECYIRGVLQLRGNLQLHIAEYVITDPILQRLKYRYHLQKIDGSMLVRWDNAPHHRGVSSFPDHKHSEDGSVSSSAAVDIFQVLTLIVPYLPSR